MYKVVNIVDLKEAVDFAELDKVIEFSSDKQQMFVGDNDYAHKNSTYLSSAINIIDTTFNAYTTAIDNVKSTYITDDITSIYLTNGSSIATSLFDKIYNSDAFLTKEKCKQLETDCISYINELKNKAVSLIIAEMNSSFIAQNSVNRIAFGQETKLISGSNQSSYITYDSNIALNANEEQNNFDFEYGEFSFYNLLFGYFSPDSALAFNTESSTYTTSTTIADFWNDNYNAVLSSFCNYSGITTFEDMLSILYDSCYVFNAQLVEDDPSVTMDYRIHVPDTTYDFEKNSTIPMAKLIELFLKRQIKQVMKRVCDNYISKMTSIPQEKNI